MSLDALDALSPLDGRYAKSTAPLRAHLSEDAAGFIDSHPVMAIHTARVLAQRLYHATTYLADMKRQFADKSDHFGMVDEILDELMQQQRQPAAAPAERSGDPRL